MEKINYKKSLGQNFIFDANLLNAIATDGEVSKQDEVLEIGAGAGTLTKVLCEHSKRVVSFEIDKSLSVYLDKIASENKNLEIYYEDFLKADIEKLNLKNARVVANIPYYITSPIIFKLATSGAEFKSILVLVQVEVARRFAANKDSKDYGASSVCLQAKYHISIPRVIKKECFTPSPKVDSALCKLIPHNLYDIDFDEFSSFVEKAFSMRRKTLMNNLKPHFDKDKISSALSKLGLEINVRPENLSVEQFVELSKLLK